MLNSWWGGGALEDISLGFVAEPKSETSTRKLVTALPGGFPKIGDPIFFYPK